MTAALRRPTSRPCSTIIVPTISSPNTSTMCWLVRSSHSSARPTSHTSFNESSFAVLVRARTRQTAAVIRWTLKMESFVFRSKYTAVLFSQPRCAKRGPNLFSGCYVWCNGSAWEQFDWTPCRSLEDNYHTLSLLLVSHCYYY